MSWERLTGQLRNGDGWLVVSGVVAAGTAIFTAVGAVVVGITLLHLAGDPAEGIGVKQYAMVIFGGLTVVLVCAAVMSAAAALGCRRGEATAPGIALAPLVVIGMGFYAVVHHTAGRPAWLLLLPGCRIRGARGCPAPGRAWAGVAARARVASPRVIPLTIAVWPVGRTQLAHGSTPG